jgi:hypothetical protein
MGKNDQGVGGTRLGISLSKGSLWVAYCEERVASAHKKSRLSTAFFTSLAAHPTKRRKAFQAFRAFCLIS